MAGIVPDIDPGQVSGGDAGGSGGGSTPVESAPQLDDFVTEEGGALAEAFGEHLVAGNLIVHKYQPGPPPSSIFTVALGVGEWDSAVKVWYAGEELSASPDGSTAGYHFHPGNISTGISDPTQGVDSFLPAGLAYSGTANVVIKLPENRAVEDRPDKMRGRFKCKKVWQYDGNGTQLTFGYSTNAANIAVDRVRRYYEQKFYYDLTLAYEKFRRRINWPKWIEWRDYNDTLITWNDGTNPTRQIKRFESHVVFTEDVTLADALDQICASVGALWQDDGEQIIFLTPIERSPSHHFHEGNIVAGSFGVAPRDIRERPNFMVAKFRNLDDTYLTEASIEVKREALIQKVGKIASERRFPNMTYSQAQRLLERQMRIEADNPVICSLRGFGDSLHVLPGDYVTVSHTVPGWIYQRCLVIDAGVDSAEKGADEVDFTLQKIDGPLYFDTDHKPVQAAVTP